MNAEPTAGNEIIFYTSPEGSKKIEVCYQDENFWMSQKQLAELFGVEINTANYHLKEIFKSNELSEDSVIRKIRITAVDGKSILRLITISSFYCSSWEVVCYCSGKYLFFILE